MESETFFTTGELARRLDVSDEQAKRIVDAAAERGLITLRRTGRVRLITPEDLDKIVVEREVSSQTKNVFGGGWPKGKPRK